MNIGIYPGAFDPVHRGHVAFCAAAMRECGLDKAVMLPERAPRGKRGVSDVTQRAARLEDALQPYEGIEVILLDDAQFTVPHTLPQLEQLFPGDDLTLLIGSDVVRTMPNWPDIGRLLPDISLAVGLRADDDIDEITAIISQFPPPVACTLVATLHSHVSSSRIRAELDSDEYNKKRKPTAEDCSITTASPGSPREDKTR